MYLAGIPNIWKMIFEFFFELAKLKKCLLEKFSEKKQKDSISEQNQTVNLLDTNQRKVIKGEI